jgi:plasmid replication initiation protein
MRWIEHVEIVKRDKVVEIRIDDTLKPYLLALKDNYTQYELGYVLVLKSKYSIRLYEMLKSYAYIGEKDYSLDELKNALQIDGYDEFRYLKRDIIDKSLSEINAHTDLQIEYKTYRTGRSIGGLVFDISKKSNVQQVVLRVKRDALLDPKTKKE